MEKGLSGVNMGSNELINEFDNQDIDIDNELDIDIRGGAGISEAMRQAVASVQEKRTKTGKIPGVESAAEHRRQKRLTAKQRAFAAYVAQGNSPKDAYKMAYNVRSTNEATLSAAANNLLRHGEVSKLLEATFSTLHENIIQDAQATRRYVMEQLISHTENAKTEGTKLKALELMGKAVGMFTDRVESKVEEVSTERLKQELEQSLQMLDNVRH